MMSYRIFIVLFFSVFYATIVYPQASTSNYFIPQYFPKAPNAAALTKFGDYNVNLFTGLPAISISLYTVEAGDLKVPITLSYHPSGVRVSDVSSWVGLGWSLSTGGTITRKTMGGPDDAENGYLRYTPRSAASININTPSEMDYVDYLVTGRRDGRPDIFSYDFPGHSGKFFFNGNDNYNVAMIPYSPVSIKKHLGTRLEGFSVLDEHGNYYSFGKKVRDLTYSVTPQRPAESAISAWPLEQIISQSKRDTVTYSYTSQTVYYPDIASNIEVVNDQLSNLAGGIYSAGKVDGGTSVSSSYTEEQLVQQILFKNGKIVFSRNPSFPRTDVNQGSGSTLYPLRDIKIYSYNFGTKQYDVLKTVVFYQGNFNQTNSNSKRLKLDSIQVLDKAGSVTERYKFTYDESAALPSYNSFARDYWGFYNGKNTSNSLIPKMTVPFNTNGSSPSTIEIGSNVANNRNSDSTYMQLGVLRSVQYPTGGRTDFTYQTNQYLDNGVLQQAGGLRISTIKSYDGVNATPITKTYLYDPLLARKNFILDLNFFSTSQTYRFYSTNGGSTSCPSMLCSKVSRTFVANPRLEMEAFDGATVVYPSVTEYIGTPTNNVGKSQYTFSDVSDYLSTASMTKIPIVMTSFYERGQLLNKTDYRRMADGTYKKVKAEINTYAAFNKTTYTNVGIVAGKNFVNDGSQSGPTPIYTNTCVIPTDANSYVVSNYNIVSGDNYLLSKTVQDYDSDDDTRFTTLTQDNFYNNIRHQQVSKIRSTDSRGTVKVITNKYPSDFAVGNTVLDSMMRKNMQAVLIERFDSVRNAATSTFGVSGGQLNLFSLSKGAFGSVVADQIKTLDVSMPINDFTPSTVTSGSVASDNRYQPAISYDSYDNRNNTIQYTPRNAGPTAIIWNYKNSLPIAEVKNATIANVAYSSFEVGGEKGGWAYSDTAFVNSQRIPGLTQSEFAITGRNVFNLSEGNSSITKSDLDPLKRYIVSFWYSSGNGVPQVNGTLKKDVAITGIAFRYAEFELTNQSYVSVSGAGIFIDELRLHPADALITTYTYDPLVGMTSSTDPSGRTTTYEYDAFQRLKVVKNHQGNILKRICYTYNGLPSGCSLPMGTGSIYVRLEGGGGSLGSNGHYYNTFIFRTYSDAGFTTLYNVPANYNVIYRVTSTTTNGSNSNTSSAIYNTTISAGSNSRSITVDVNTCGQVGSEPPPGTSCTTASVELIQPATES